MAKLADLFCKNNKGTLIADEALTVSAGNIIGAVVVTEPIVRTAES